MATPTGTPNGELYAMFVVFKDGNKRIRYSRDFKRGRDKKKGKRNKIHALAICFSYLNRFQDAVKTFEIYDHHPGMPPNGKKVFKWEQGIVEHDEITHLVL